MTLQPVSSLSIKKAVNLYTIILFLSFGSLLYWLATERFEVLVNLHKDTASTTTKIVAFELNKTLKEKQRMTGIFLENSQDLIAGISKQTTRKKAFEKLKARLKKYHPDFYAFNIMSESEGFLIGDFNANDRKHLNHEIKNAAQRIHLHSNHNADHYDLISEQTSRNYNYIFYISFKTTDLIETLSSIQPKNHTLLLVNKDNDNNLIKARIYDSEQLTENEYKSKMNGHEKIRTLSESKIKNTNWYVIDLHEEGFFNKHKVEIITEYTVAYYIFILIALFMRNILLVQDKKRTVAEKKLHENNEQIKTLNNKLELLSITDGLTGLYNRRYFDQIIQQEWNRGLRSQQPISCILIDIDYFKYYNDCYGHQAGDKCLINLASVMKETFRRAGDIVARYGGEEFIIIMPNISLKETEITVINFQQELANLKIQHNESSVNSYVTVSAGIVTQIPTQDESIEDFIRKADKALYQAKDNGRNQFVAHK